MTERRCAHSKNIDLTVVGNSLVVLNKDGWIQIIDYTKKPKIKLPKKKSKAGGKDSPQEIESDDEESPVTYQLENCKLILILAEVAEYTSLARADNELGLVAIGFKHYPKEIPPEKSTGSTSPGNKKSINQEGYTVTSFTTFTFEENRDNPNFDIVKTGDVKISGDKCRINIIRYPYLQNY